jgi:hypothetical protein
VRAHSAVPEDGHQTFVVSNEDTIPDDGSFAAIAVSTPALLRNVSAVVLHHRVQVGSMQQPFCPETVPPPPTEWIPLCLILMANKIREREDE